MRFTLMLLLLPLLVLSQGSGWGASGCGGNVDPYPTDVEGDWRITIHESILWSEGRDEVPYSSFGGRHDYEDGGYAQMHCDRGAPPCPLDVLDLRDTDVLTLRNAGPARVALHTYRHTESGRDRDSDDARMDLDPEGVTSSIRDWADRGSHGCRTDADIRLTFPDGESGRPTQLEGEIEVTYENCDLGEHPELGPVFRLSIRTPFSGARIE